MPVDFIVVVVFVCPTVERLILLLIFVIHLIIVLIRFVQWLRNCAFFVCPSIIRVVTACAEPILFLEKLVFIALR